MRAARCTNKATAPMDDSSNGAAALLLKGKIFTMQSG